MQEEGYNKDDIKLWIARAMGRATTQVSQETCADIAMAMLMYNQLYAKEEQEENDKYE